MKIIGVFAFLVPGWYLSEPVPCHLTAWPAIKILYTNRNLAFKDSSIKEC